MTKRKTDSCCVGGLAPNTMPSRIALQRYSVSAYTFASEKATYLARSSAMPLNLSGAR